MTGEEAKSWLDKLYLRADITDEYGDMEDMQPYEEAITMAISAINTIELIKSSSSFTNLQKAVIEEMMRGNT